MKKFKVMYNNLLPGQQIMIGKEILKSERIHVPGTNSQCRPCLQEINKVVTIGLDWSTFGI